MTAFLIIAAVIALIMLVSAIDCTLNIAATEYEEVLSGIETPLKIVCISDLHGWRYGKGNSKLLALIAEQKPEAIIIAGDMITRRASEKQIHRVLEFISKLTSVAPVYYATGNHEADYMAENGMKLLDEFSSVGAVVLYDRYTDARIGDNTIRIGAASGRYFDGSERDRSTLDMLKNIGTANVPSIAIVHQPENIFMNEEHNEWTADLYLSGHTHGGIWRIPGIGGVMSPAEGLFPKYDKGKYMLDGKMPLIISGGLSGYYFIPRVFNRPEICTITLK